MALCYIHTRAPQSASHTFLPSVTIRAAKRHFWSWSIRHSPHWGIKMKTHGECLAPALLCHREWWRGRVVWLGRCLCRWRGREMRFLTEMLGFVHGLRNRSCMLLCCHTCHFCRQAFLVWYPDGHSRHLSASWQAMSHTDFRAQKSHTPNFSRSAPSWGSSAISQQVTHRSKLPSCWVYPQSSLIYASRSHSSNQDTDTFRTFQPLGSFESTALDFKAVRKLSPAQQPHSCSSQHSTRMFGMLTDLFRRIVWLRDFG